MATLSRWTSALRCWLCRLLLMLLASVSVAANAPTEYQVKAVFLFNFTQFVEWPADAFADEQTPFVIGVLGRDPFGSALDDAVRGETVNGRPLVVQRYRNIGELKPCQILFIDRSARADAERVLASLANQRTLTVSDLDLEGDPSVIIRFLTQDRKIRLRINVGAARAAGLTISSKLLRPAQVVGTQGAG